MGGWCRIRHLCGVLSCPSKGFASCGASHASWPGRGSAAWLRARLRAAACAGRLKVGERLRQQWKLKALPSLLHIPVHLRRSATAMDEDSRSPWDPEAGLLEAPGALSPTSPEMRLRRVNLPWRFWRGFLWFPQRYEETKARGCCAGRTPVSGASLASSISSGSP
ncbi:unnamed protein product [Symbiodinium sp. CCMP2592]|nr:unnamed protein product [Symbiodinium sp. CCMP2592]